MDYNYHSKKFSAGVFVKKPGIASSSEKPVLVNAGHYLQHCM